MATVNTSSVWFNIKATILPTLIKGLSVLLFLVAVWFVVMALFNGGYIMLPPFASFCDNHGLGEMIQPEIKERMENPDVNLFLLLARYVLFKYAILIIICLGARYAFMQFV